MNFHEYPCSFTAAKRARAIPPRMDYKEFYTRLIAHTLPGITTTCTPDEREIDTASRAAEAVWCHQHRPFYNVWPKIIPMLVRLDIAGVAGEMLSINRHVLLLRMPMSGNTLVASGVTVRSVLLQRIHSRVYDCDGFLLNVDIGELESSARFPVITRELLPFVHGRSIAETLQSGKQYASALIGTPFPKGLRDDVIRLCCTLLLLEHSPEIVERVVLSADRLKYEQTADHKYVARAERRGVVGWDIGKQIEVMPHYRRPHFGLRWCGEKHAIPRIVPIKGSIVHRDLVEKIPTGYQGVEQTDGVTTSSRRSAHLPTVTPQHGE